jgi:hypothetical protein
MPCNGLSLAMPLGETGMIGGGDGVFDVLGCCPAVAAFVTGDAPAAC